MQPIVGRIEQLTNQPCPPTGGSGVPSQASKIIVPFVPDANAIDEAQKKADKLKATLSEVQELIRKPNIEYEILSDIRVFEQTEELIKKICAAHKDANLKIRITFS